MGVSLDGICRSARLPARVALAAILAGCGGASGSREPPPLARTLSPLAAVGEFLFHDTALSVSGQQSCATCHDKAHAFAAADGAPVPLGGPLMNLPGFRNAPSLAYASFTPGFDVIDGAPTGGFFRDGRASSLARQARLPFVTPFEMANADAAAVLARLRARPYFGDLEAIYGADIQSDPDQALAAIGEAIAAYEREGPAFHPFSSKFDAFTAGTATLTPTELKGLALFNNPGKGNCTACHPSQRQEFADYALFTDFSFDTIGVPRNWAIAANAPVPRSPVDGSLLTYTPLEPTLPAGSAYAYYDLGPCGPFAPAASDPAARVDLAHLSTMCGAFKVPTLRNVALTAPYFHNGVFATLREVVRWYVTRDIAVNQGNNPDPQLNPYAPGGTFYLAADGSADALLYNDLPLAFDAAVNIGEVPYTPPAKDGGQSPTLTSDEIDALVAFLCTLTDGFDPDHPEAYALPAECTGRAAGSAFHAAIARAH